MPSHRIPPHQRTNARHLRAEMTNVERLLWRHLRGGQIGGHKFRRQHPIGVYIADFACIELKLIVEVDGGQHNGSAGDVDRDAWLLARGWRVLRFWNNEVMANVEGVVTVIASVCTGGATRPPPQPSPWKGEGAKT